MNSLAKNTQILGFYPLLFDVILGFIEVSQRCGNKKRDTAPHWLDFRYPNLLPFTNQCRI